MKIADLTSERYGRPLRTRATFPPTQGVLTDMRTATTRHEEPMLAGTTYYEEIWVTPCIDDVWIEPLKARTTNVELLD